MERAVVFDYLRLSQTAETRLLKKVNVRQLFMLLSVSLFSLVFSSSSFPSFLRPFNSYISTSFLFRLLTHTVDKNCIFLICNGILVFLARSSGLIKGSRFWSNGSYKGPRQAEPLSTLHMKARASEYTDERFPGDLVRGSDYSPMGNADGYSMEGGQKESKDLTENRESSEHKEEVITTSVGGEERPIEEHKTRGATSPGEEDGFDQTGDDHGDDQVQEEEEEEEEEDADMLGSKVLSTEELNKKFDEFIRRMKEEISIEDQQQLVMV